MGWMICREGDAEPEYFRGALFGADQAWSRDPDQAYQFLSRRVAVDVMVMNIPHDETCVRVVPVFLDSEAG